MRSGVPARTANAHAHVLADENEVEYANLIA